LLLAATILNLLLSQGPSTLRIDATDDASYRRTRAAVQGALSPTEQARFQEAIAAILLVETRRAKNPAQDFREWDAAVQRQLHGKSAVEVIRLASELRIQHAPLFLAAAEYEAELTLGILLNKQRLLQMQASIDVDGNGRGEAGYFGEITGTVGARDRQGTPTGARLELKPRESGWDPVANGRITHKGYLVQIYLPGKDGVAIPEAPRGGVNRPAPDPSLAETWWCAYAWPAEHGKTGNRAFFVCQDGTVLATDNARQRYSGHDNPPHPGAAYPASTAGMAHRPGDGGVGNDGQEWRPARPRAPVAPPGR
jgi:hypothetical protein